MNCVTTPCNINGTICTASGELHYKTFDKKRYDFHGRCQYVHVEKCKNSEFSIKSVMSYYQKTMVSRISQVHVKVPGVTIILARGKPIPVIINGNNMTANDTNTTVYNANKVGIMRLGRQIIVVLLEIGIRVSWDGFSRVSVKATQHLRGQLCGMCGTYDGDPNNDMQTRGGSLVTSAAEFGKSWEVPGSCSRVSKRQIFDIRLSPGCSKDPILIRLARDRCRILEGGDFTKCHDVLDVSPYVEDCEIDFLCSDDETREDFYCNDLEYYAEDCAYEGVTIILPTCRKLIIYNATY